MEESRFWLALWFSGFFALGAVVHLIRIIMGFGITVAGHEIPLSFSLGAVLVFGALSVGLLGLSLIRPCDVK